MPSLPKMMPQKVITGVICDIFAVEYETCHLLPALN